MKYVFLICLFLTGCTTKEVDEVNGKYFCRVDTGKAYETHKAMSGLISLRELPVADYLCKKSATP